MPDYSAESDPKSVSYDIEHTYGIYHLQSEEVNTSPENRTYIEESRVTPDGWTADSDGTHIERAHLDCEEVTLEELQLEFLGHHTVILRPENVPGDIENREPMMTPADVGYQFAVRPDERDELDNMETAETAGGDSGSRTGSAADPEATDEPTVDEGTE